MVVTACWNCSFSVKYWNSRRTFLSKRWNSFTQLWSFIPQKFWIIDYATLKTRKLQNVINCFQIGWIWEMRNINCGVHKTHNMWLSGWPSAFRTRLCSTVKDVLSCKNINPTFNTFETKKSVQNLHRGWRTKCHTVDCAHNTFLLLQKHLTSGTELILIGCKIVPNEEHV